MSLAKQTVVDTDIRDVIYGNYMPYAVKVLLDRAIPDLQDGLKPSQRRILYTMYKQKLFNNKTKSANVVGEVMKLHPHGDMAIYETMTRMTDKYGAWNFPLIYGKGNFGSVTSNFASAAPRYTEAMLEDHAKEYFEFLDSVEMLPSYDNKNTEPKALPVNFPAVLANPTEGIAVGFATSIPSFNVIDLIEATKATVQGEEFNYMDLRPDFPTGGSIVTLYESMKEIWTKGKGSIPIYATYSIEQKGRYFEMVVTELPYGVIIENVIDGLYKLAKRDNYFKTRFIEARDESGIKGFKLVIKFNGEPDAIVNYVLNKSDLQKNYPVNINVIDGNSLKQIGVRHLLREWCKWRKEIVSKHFKMLVEDLANKLMFLQAYMSFMSKVDIDEWVKLVKNEDNDIVLYNYLKAKVTPFNQQIFEFLLDLKIKDIRKFSFGQKKEQVVNLTKELQRAEGIVLNPVPFIVDELSGLQVKFKKKGYRQKSVIHYEYPEDLTPVTVIYEKPVDRSNVQIGITEDLFIYKNSMNAKMPSNCVYNVNCKANDVIMLFASTGEIYKVYLENIEYTTGKKTGVFILSDFGIEDAEIIDIKLWKPDRTYVFCDDDGRVCIVSSNEFATDKRKQKYIQKGFADGNYIGSIEFADSDSDNVYVKVTSLLGKQATVKFTDILRKSKTAKTVVFAGKIDNIRDMQLVELTGVVNYKSGEATNVALELV